MSENIKAEIGQRMRDYTLNRFFSNAVSVRRELGLPVPGQIVGDCAAMAKELAEVIEEFPGQARLHRVINPKYPDLKCGLPGAHVLLAKGTPQATYFLDPTVLHHEPFVLGQDERVHSHLPSMSGGPSRVNFTNEGDTVVIEHFGVQKGMGANAMYRFYTAPEHAVTATGLENAAVHQGSYVIRGVLPSGVFQMLFDVSFTRQIWWIEEGSSRPISLEAREDHSALEEKLRPLGLDLGMAVKFLRDTPGLKQELQSQLGYD